MYFFHYPIQVIFLSLHSSFSFFNLKFSLLLCNVHFSFGFFCSLHRLRNQRFKQDFEVYIFLSSFSFCILNSNLMLCNVNSNFLFCLAFYAPCKDLGIEDC